VAQATTITDDTTPGWESGVLASLYRVAFATPDREVAGVLVGIPGSDGHPPTVQAVVPAAEGIEVGQASRFTHQTWSVIHSTMARHYAGLEVVGWYLSRPGMGTELIEADIANHQRWFDSPKQVLLTLDSRAHRGALYQSLPQGLVRLHEGPVARRHTRPEPPPGIGGAVALLAVLGVALGALLFLVIQVLNTL
jgi:proteasome lid subunit RPN8/RPN11